MKKRSGTSEVIFLVASLGLAVALAVAGGRLAKTDFGKSESDSPTDFRLATLDDRELGPPDFRGQVVVLDFWATWCIPCRYQEGILAQIHSDLEDQDVQILAINLGEEESTVQDYYSEELPPWPVLLDLEDRLTAGLGIEALPSLMVLDRHGEIVYFDVGILDANALSVQIELAGSI